MSPWLLYTVNMIKLHANLLQTAFSDMYDSTYCALVYFSRHVLFRHIFQDSFHHFLTNGWSAANGCRQNKRSHSFKKNKSIFKIWSPKSIITLPLIQNITYQLFGRSFWRHPFTAEHPLLNKWSNATFLQIWWRNKLICISDDLRMSTF